MNSNSEIKKSVFIAESSFLNGDIKPEDLDWNYCNLKLKTGEELFALVAEMNEMAVLKHPIRILVTQTSEPSKFKMNIVPLNPFTDDVYTSIQKINVANVNFLSHKYRLMYKKAIFEYYGEEDAELEADEESLNSDEEIFDQGQETVEEPKVIH